jgi:hypothetical protein
MQQRSKRKEGCRRINVRGSTSVGDIDVQYFRRVLCRAVLFVGKFYLTAQCISSEGDQPDECSLEGGQKGREKAYFVLQDILIPGEEEKSPTQTTQ